MLMLCNFSHSDTFILKSPLILILILINFKCASICHGARKTDCLPFWLDEAQIYIIAYHKVQTPTPLPIIPSVSPSFPPFLLSLPSLWSWESCYHGYRWTIGSNPLKTIMLPPTTHMRMLSVWSNGDHPSHGWVFIWRLCLLLSVPNEKYLWIKDTQRYPPSTHTHTHSPRSNLYSSGNFHLQRQSPLIAAIII